MLTPLALEEISLNAWPATQTVLYDGWVLRFAEGYTRRANSISPLYPSSLTLDAKLDTCERLYRERGLPVIFKLAQSASPPGLDAALADHGYREDASTAVQILNLERAAPHPAPDARVEETPTVEWLDAYARMSNLPDRNRGILSRILANIVPAHAYASISLEGSVVATGLAVAQSGYIGLYDIVTDPACRGRGFGGQIVQSLLAWGVTQDAELAYLQVMLDNLPALRLYARLGFTEFYRYWYRVRNP
jgi:ribosomal protein S18 acetylase RimI-like enzyme